MQRYSICEEGRGLNWQLRVITEMCSESGYGVVDGVGGRTEYLRDGIRPESESEKVVKKGVPLQLGCVGSMVVTGLRRELEQRNSWSR